MPTNENTSAKASAGDSVQVAYKGTLDDGEVFDASDRHGEPLTFVIGEEAVLAGFENAVIGKAVGEENTITLSPNEAYGERNSDLQQVVPRKEIPENVVKGATFIARLPDGQEIPVHIADVSEETVTLDMNHPLAGRTLHFWIKVVSITKKS